MILLEVSVEFYKGGVFFNVEVYIFFVLVEVNWFFFDNMWWGFGFVMLVGIVCFFVEIFINK